MNNPFSHTVCIHNPDTQVRCSKLLGTRGFGVEWELRRKWRMPLVPLYTETQLSTLQAFYHVVKRASVNNTKDVLVFGDRFKFSPQFNRVFQAASENLPRVWDLIYFGYDSASYRQKPDKDIFVEINYATGLYAIAINNSFYHLFLETARVPLYPLDEHIKSVSLVSHVFCINPAIVIPP